MRYCIGWVLLFPFRSILFLFQMARWSHLGGLKNGRMCLCILLLESLYISQFFLVVSELVWTVPEKEQNSFRDKKRMHYFLRGILWNFFWILFWTIFFVLLLRNRCRLVCQCSRCPLCECCSWDFALVYASLSCWVRGISQDWMDC